MSGFFQELNNTTGNLTALLDEIRTNKLIKDEEVRTLLILKINEKNDLFLDQIKKAHGTRRVQLNHSRQLFIKAVTACLEKPDNAAFYMKQYCTSSTYYQVAGPRGTFVYTAADAIASPLLQLSVLVLGLSFALMPVALPVGIAAACLSLAVLLPSLFYICAETIPNHQRAKKEDLQLVGTLKAAFAEEQPLEEQPSREDILPLDDINPSYCPS